MNSRLLIFCAVKSNLSLEQGEFINCISDEGLDVKMFMILLRLQIKLAWETQRALNL